MDPDDPGNVPEWYFLSDRIKDIAHASGSFDAQSGFWRGHMVYFNTTLLSGAPGVDEPIDGDANLDQLWFGVNLNDFLELDYEGQLTMFSADPDSLSIKTRHYTTRLGMIQDLTDQVGRLGALLRIRSEMVRNNNPPLNWRDIPEHERLLHLEVRTDGRLVLRVEHECLRDYWFRLGDAFRRLFGDNRFRFILGVADHVITHEQDRNYPLDYPYRNDDNIYDSLDYEPIWPGALGPLIPPPPALNDFRYELRDATAPNGRTFVYYRNAYSGFYYGDYPEWHVDRFRYIPMYNNPHGGESVAIRSEESFALLEVPRRKLIVEASYPISHTTSWESTDEKRYVQFQEFKVVPDLQGGIEVNTGNGLFEEKIYTGARIFLDNHGTLALKKLFEGQLQALRIDVLEELEDDEDNRTRVPVKLRDNGFMYLKWLFTKETV